MSLSNDALIAFHYRSYGTFFLQSKGSIIPAVDLPTTEIIELVYLFKTCLLLEIIFLCDSESFRVVAYWLILGKTMYIFKLELDSFIFCDILN